MNEHLRTDILVQNFLFYIEQWKLVQIQINQLKEQGDEGYYKTTFDFPLSMLEYRRSTFYFFSTSGITLYSQK